MLTSHTTSRLPVGVQSNHEGHFGLASRFGGAGGGGGGAGFGGQSERVKCDGGGTRCFLKWNPETLAVRQRGEKKKWGRHCEQSNTGNSNSTAIWHD